MSLRVLLLSFRVQCVCLLCPFHPLLVIAHARSIWIRFDGERDKKKVREKPNRQLSIPILFPLKLRPHSSDGMSPTHRPLHLYGMKYILHYT